MKIKYIQLIVLPLFVLLMTSQVRADVTINWVADSLSAVDVIITGPGLCSNNWYGSGAISAGFNCLNNPITSPSGLWELGSEDNAWNEGTWVSIPYNAIGIAERGALSLTIDPNGFNGYTGGSADTYYDGTTSPPFQYGNILSITDSENVQGGQGFSHMIVTSLPDLKDPSTWTWTIEYSISGITVVPEPETAGLVLFGAGFLALGKLTGSHSKNRTPSIV